MILLLGITRKDSEEEKGAGLGVAAGHLEYRCVVRNLPER